jgi:hypothetical protein
MICNNCKRPINAGEKYHWGPATRRPHHADCSSGSGWNGIEEDDINQALLDAMADRDRLQQEKAALREEVARLQRIAAEALGSDYREGTVEALAQYCATLRKEVEKANALISEYEKEHTLSDVEVKQWARSALARAANQIPFITTEMMNSVNEFGEEMNQSERAYLNVARAYTFRYIACELGLLEVGK